MEGESIESDTRYEAAQWPNGIGEDVVISPRTPYGVSKACAEFYFADYAQTYGLRTTVFRQSCIYGPHQIGAEEQGWVAWFARAALAGLPVRIFGDGKQVRDVLYIDDLLDAYDAAVERIDDIKGEVFNIGGGPAHTVSIWSEFAPILERLAGQSTDVEYADWRDGDQRSYISDIRKAGERLGWTPQTNLEEGLAKLLDWLRSQPPTS